ncbi:MAG: LytTR family DNA-binding domain-containing protein [Bacteroidota bacterium]
MGTLKKVIIVDDEAPARSLVKEYLQEYTEFVLIQECNNGVDALKAINEFRPDLVFMDIQMPGMTGFEVLQHLEHLPKIIFSTAYDQYALQAFEVHALDYLLKPYTRERFADAIRRMMDSSGAYMNQLHELMNSFSTPEAYSDKVLVSVNAKLISVPVADIIWIEASGDYARLVQQDRYYLSNQGISQLEQKMNPKLFTRVHRSAMININHVKEVYKYPSGYEVVMVNGDLVKVSRSYLDNIRKLIV